MFNIYFAEGIIITGGILLKKLIFFLLIVFILTASSACTNPNADVDKTQKDLQSDKYEKELSSASELMQTGDYEGAVKSLDNLFVQNANEDISNLRKRAYDLLKNQAVEKVDKLIRDYDYKSAAEVLQPVKLLMKEEDQRLLDLYDTCISFSNLVPYNGPVEHIFFHPLIAYPELAFDGDYQQQGFDNFMVTVEEFKRTMEAFYDADYILIDIKLLYSVDEKGTVTQRPLMLPEGKKPLVLSLDDYNFLKYMRQNGCVYGLTLDKHGNVITFTNNSDGTISYSDDNEVVPIIDKYVSEHPDFSFGGAKGVIGLNGYEGALGYPTDELDSPDYSSNFSKARAVADRLKETGWSFACHSYSHYRPGKRTLAQMKYDTDKWIKEVGAVVGKTDIYIYPFGEQIPANDPKFQYMLQSGYRMFCGVQQQPLLSYKGSFALQMRRNIDGISLKGKHLPKIIDVSNIPDPIRPWYSEFKNKLNIQQ